MSVDRDAEGWLKLTIKMDPSRAERLTALGYVLRTDSMEWSKVIPFHDRAIRRERCDLRACGVAFPEFAFG